jgi:hypothetical protein
MIRRTATAMMIGLVAWLGMSVLSAGAQSPATDATEAAAAAVVVVRTSDADPAALAPVLARTETPTVAPTMAVFLGLTMIGATLAVITARRRALHVPLVDDDAGVAGPRSAPTGRRGAAVPARVRPAGPPADAERGRRAPGGDGALLVGSADSVSASSSASA